MEQRRADFIADRLEEMVFDGTFENGDRLDETRLAEQFGVSRTPLREAFQRLAVSGLVEHLPRRGVFVRQPGPVALIEMFEVMAELEAAAARFAALRITDAALEDLQSTNARCDEAALRQDADAYYAENMRFHSVLNAQSGNDFLQQECLRLFKRLKPFRRAQLRARGRMRQSQGEHQQIIEALRDGDATRAAEVMRAHVAVQGEKFHNLLATTRAPAKRSQIGKNGG